MKKSAIRTSAIVLALTLTLTGLSAEGAGIKAGASCSKAGITAVVGSKKFTCVTVSGKRVWNKGVALKTTPRVLPNASPSPSATLAPVTYDNLNPSTTWQIAHKISYAQAAAAPFAKVNIIFSIGPSLNQNVIEPYTNGMQTVANILAPLWKPDSYRYLAFLAADTGWLDSAIASNGGDPTATPMRQLWSTYVNASRDCNMASASTGRLGPLTIQCFGSLNPRTAQTSAHEFFHTFQQAMGSGNYPVWFSEGGATYIGVHLGYYPGLMASGRDITSDAYRNKGTQMDEGLRVSIKSGDASAIINRFKILEAKDASADIRNSSYYLGWMASEALIAVDGWGKWIKLHTDLKSKTFAASFKDNYGMTLDDFYPMIAKYIIAQ